MGVFRAIMAWLHLVVGKVAATTAGHQNFFTHFIAVLQHQHPAPPLACRSRAHKPGGATARSEEHTSELQSRGHLVCRLLLEKKKRTKKTQSKSTSTRSPTHIASTDRV